LTLDPELTALLDSAQHSLARLDLAGAMVPSIEWFLYAFVRKEAVVSAQIEGTQASLVDLLTYESDAESGVPAGPDVEEVCNYLEASRYALGELRRPDGLPISMRLLNGAHHRLMLGARGSDRLPGEIRRSQNWIGGTRPGNAVFVPPPPHELPAALGALEQYIHAEDVLPPLVRAGLVHVQFETLHPYLDGNGRIGRLLVTLLFHQWELLSQPLLYLSLFLKRHRQEYYRRLNAVRTEGDWESWIAFFLEGVDAIAREATEAARQLFALLSADRERLLAMPAATVMSLRLFELLPRHPILSAGRAMKLLEVSRPTADKALGVLQAAGVLVETTGRKRDRTFSYGTYLDLLRVGTEV
jgi:Fic family protein